MPPPGAFQSTLFYTFNRGRVEVVARRQLARAAAGAAWTAEGAREFLAPLNAATCRSATSSTSYLPCSFNHTPNQTKYGILMTNVSHSALHMSPLRSCRWCLALFCAGLFHLDLIPIQAQPFAPTEVGTAVNGFQDDFTGTSLGADWQMRGRSEEHTS